MVTGRGGRRRDARTVSWIDPGVVAAELARWGETEPHSRLGVADYAIAFADELETPHARCARLVIG
jgi:hypothetical protein